ncbi:hypothetical protein [Chondromyces crocatus]|uniref:Secreted protein n=1 Tax=Chondromyces crocatus TaxID=52 RepID=A0A0K1E6D5_CHOCO|nr:hypothetical protein [Chondromyces crocatus]AKT36419.1 uncharacterized protein CMC5_005320 [Chondromyces crocatus]
MTFQANRPVKAMPTTQLKRGFAAVLLALSAGVIAPACADNESSLFIRDCVPAVPTDQGCVTQDASSASVYLFNGRLDLAYQPAYSCALRVGNQLVQQGTNTQIRTETSRISLYAADVRITDASGNAITYADGSAVAFSVPLSGFIDPGSGTSAGYGYANILMIDQAAGQAIGRSLASAGVISTDILVGVIVYGRSLGGQELETVEWFFPIQVCLGCACTEPEGCTADDGTSDVSPPCTTDSPIDCRVAQGIPGGARTCSERIAAAAQYYSQL